MKINHSFLNSLSEAYKEVKMSLKYGRQKTTIDDVILAIKTRELELNSQRRNQSNSEGLFSKGKSKKNTQKKSRIRRINQNLNAHFAIKKGTSDKTISF